MDIWTFFNIWCCPAVVRSGCGALVYSCVVTFLKMVSRAEVELLLKTQRDCYSDTVNHLIKSFENRVSKFEGKLTDCKQEISDLRRFSEEQKLVIRDLKSVVDELKDSVVTSEATPESFITRLDYLEDQSRRNNLRFEGIVEETGENWEQTAKKVEVIVRERLGITDTIQIERAHRVGKFNSERPRLVVAKFLRFNDRENILRSSGKLKGTNIYINEDLCENSQAKR